jgi:hypothetical protein
VSHGWFRVLQLDRSYRIENFSFKREERALVETLSSDWNVCAVSV